MYFRFGFRLVCKHSNKNNELTLKEPEILKLIFEDNTSRITTKSLYYFPQQLKLPEQNNPSPLTVRWVIVDAGGGAGLRRRWGPTLLPVRHTIGRLSTAAAVVPCPLAEERGLGQRPAGRGS